MLTERKKADRAQMATAVAMLAASLGANVEIEPEGSNSIAPRRVVVRMRAARGLCLTVDFDGDSTQPDTHILSWHMATDVDTCLASAFCRVGDVSAYHFRKATSVAEGFDDLCDVLRRGLEIAASGEAFSDEREAAAIAERGETAAQRDAVLDRAFAANKAAGESGALGPAFSMDCAAAIAFIEKWAPDGVPLAISADGRRVVAADAACASRPVAAAA